MAYKLTIKTERLVQSKTLCKLPSIGHGAHEVAYKLTIQTERLVKVKRM